MNTGGHLYDRLAPRLKRGQAEEDDPQLVLQEAFTTGPPISSHKTI